MIPEDWRQDSRVRHILDFLILVLEEEEEEVEGWEEVEEWVWMDVEEWE